MNICVITSAHPIYDKRVFRQIKACLENEHSIEYIVPVDSSDEIIEIDNLNYHKIKKGGMIKRIFNLPIILYKCFKVKADVYHIHDPDLMFVGVILSRFKKNVIFDIHEHYADKFLISKKIPVFFREFMYKFYTKFEDWCANQIKNIIVVEDSQKERFNKLRDTEVEIIYNYPSIDEALTEPKLQSENVVLIHSGSLTEYRGIMIIVEVAKKIKELNLYYSIYLIDYFYSEKEEKQIKELINKLGLNKIITFFPKVPQEEIYYFLKKGNIGVSFLLDIPKYQKGIPTKFFEYMACGLPIIASDLYYSEKYITANNCGITKRPNDIMGFIEAIDKISSNFSFYSNNSYKSFEKYKWTLESEKLINFYEGFESK